VPFQTLAASQVGLGKRQLSGLTAVSQAGGRGGVSGVRVVQLLECDPELGEGLSGQERASATRALPVQATSLQPGPWRPDAEPREPGHLGYLVAAGLLVRRVEVGTGSSVELLGRGDLLRPWQEEISSFCTASWEVLERTTVVALGSSLVRDMSQWPAIVSNMLARGVRRSRAVAADAAIASIVGVEERLLILLWQIAETWGEAKEDGIHISIQLPHRLLAELVGARRPSVTSALSELQQSGRLVSSVDGCWVLLGDPPC
jgi:CRP/FNR family transcriptional regulator, cyclic AMP receptor protein